MLKKKFKIAIAEDDEYYNQVLVKTVQHICSSEQFDMFDCEIKSYLSGQKCADNIDYDTDILILDHYLDNHANSFYNAFDMMKAVQEKCKSCKVIVMSGQRNKTVEKDLMIKGAYEYVDKERDGTQHLRQVVTKIMKEEATRFPTVKVA